MITTPTKKRLLTVILLSGLLAGTLDIVAAFIHYYINYNKNPLRVLLFIASGVFGKSAYTGGNAMYVAGAVFHYLIAYSFTVVFFLFYPLISKLRFNRVVTGIVFGALIWLVMNLVVIPLSKTPSIPFHWPKALLAIGILIIAIGIPLSFLAYNHYLALRQAAQNPPIHPNVRLR